MWRRPWPEPTTSTISVTCTHSICPNHEMPSHTLSLSFRQEFSDRECGPRRLWELRTMSPSTLLHLRLFARTPVACKASSVPHYDIQTMIVAANMQRHHQKPDPRTLTAALVLVLEVLPVPLAEAAVVLPSSSVPSAPSALPVTRNWSPHGASYTCAAEI